MFYGCKFYFLMYFKFCVSLYQPFQSLGGVNCSGFWHFVSVGILLEMHGVGLEPRPPSIPIPDVSWIS